MDSNGLARLSPSDAGGGRYPVWRALLWSFFTGTVVAALLLWDGDTTQGQANVGGAIAVGALAGLAMFIYARDREIIRVAAFSSPWLFSTGFGLLCAMMLFGFVAFLSSPPPILGTIADSVGVGAVCVLLMRGVLAIMQRPGRR